ncbi:MAG TPA: hypothetical protein VMY36_00080 [Patescibacteria group bacterium]|nr:hypothetical protein [Patescibacteria group bacterium]
MSDRKIFGNERDPELLELERFLKNCRVTRDSILDIGPWSEGSTKICSDYTHYLDTIDLVQREALGKMVKNQYVEDFLFFDLPQYDFVVCVSTLEHIGVTPIAMRDCREMELLAVKKMIGLAEKGVFLSFPYGEAILIKAKYNNIDRTMVKEMEKMARGFKFEKKFLSTATLSDPDSWQEVSQDEADKATNELSGGIKTICIISMLK